MRGTVSSPRPRPAAPRWLAPAVAGTLLAGLSAGNALAAGPSGRVDSPAIGKAGGTLASAATGPATLSPAVTAAIAKLAPGSSLDLILTLDRPASKALGNALSDLGVWSKTFTHLPNAAVRLPIERLALLQALPGVRAVYLNRTLHYDLAESAKLMNTAHAWNDLGITGKGVNIAILDSGVDFTHPDLAPAEVDNVKLAELGPPTPTVDIPLPRGLNSDTTSGHGTHVAGDAAGRGTKSGGKYKGMGFGAGLVGLGAGEAIEIFTALDGFEYVLANKDKDHIRVVTNSWGTDFSPADPTDPINVATKAVHDAGIVVLFAMGNSYDEMTQNPYATPWVIPVAAGTKAGAVTDFSSGGIEADQPGAAFDGTTLLGEHRSIGHLGSYHPSVTSTGQNVVSTRSLSTIVPLTGAPDDIALAPSEIPYYTTLSGTSMATPETAGVVAMILEADPALNPDQVKQVLETSARTIDGVAFQRQGYGYTDASGAVELALKLKGLSTAKAAAVLQRLHDARDRKILAGIAHPSATVTAREKLATGPNSVERKIEVPATTARVKVVSSGPATLELNVVEWDITVTDAAGKTVGATSNLPSNFNSGAAVLDIDLAKAVPAGTTLTYGTWTVTFTTTDSPGIAVPGLGSLGEDTFSPPILYDVIALFDTVPIVCKPVPTFVATGSQELRLQDDGATVGPYAGDPSYQFVGRVRNGSLGARTPREIAGLFDITTVVPGPSPTFSTPPLAAPLTIGGAIGLEVWVSGKSDLVSGSLQGTVLDVSPDGTAKAIATADGSVGVSEGLGKPAKTDQVLMLGSPYTIETGHRLGLALGITFVGTVGNTLFYDSERTPSGITLTTGRIKRINPC